jgi:hypothetical protein
MRYLAVLSLSASGCVPEQDESGRVALDLSSASAGGRTSSKKEDGEREEQPRVRRVELLGRSVFIVEDDMVFESKESVDDYFRSPTSKNTKSIVNLTSSGSRDVRADRDPSTTVNEVPYCFSSGPWGSTVDLDSNGIPDDFNADGIPDTMPSIAQIKPGLEAGIRAWEGVANVRFLYDQANDGVPCASASVSFRVALNPSSPGTANGPFPSSSVQAFLIPRSGLSETLAIHELGHTLGFRHEHIHSGASPRCLESADYEQLFAEFDPQSAMLYDNCTVNKFIAGFRVSRLDGMGARILYGNPHWWYAGVVF